MLLRSMRNGFLSAIFLGLLVMGAMGLILSDWNGMFRGGVTATDVAVVDGEPIKIQDFHNRLSNALRSRNIDPKDAYQLGLVDAFCVRIFSNACSKNLRKTRDLPLTIISLPSAFRRWLPPQKRRHER